MAAQLLKDEPLYVPQGVVRNYTLYSSDVELDELDSETSRARSSLAGATITMKVRNAADVVQFTKVSSDSAQIEIHGDQVTETTKGTALLKLLGVDSTALTVGEEYWYDVWCLYADTRYEPIVKKSRFHVLDGVVTDET